MTVLRLRATSETVLAVCGELGLVVRLERSTADVRRHWHVGRPSSAGTLELTETPDGVELRVAANRDGGWATATARQLAEGLGDRNLLKRRRAGVFLAALATALVAAPLTTAGPRLPEAQPVDAISGLLAQFETHPVVAVGEIHGWPREHDFLRALIRDPRFGATVNDIVVEFGNQRYQSLVDRYVLDGERIPYKRVRQAWTMTTQRPTGVWDVPIYQQFYVAVRNHNLTLPREQRVRLVLGDSPIDWRQIKRWTCDRPRLDCFDYWLGRRDVDFAAAVEREVLAKGHRALVIAGGFHVIRGPFTDGDNVTAAVEREHPRSVFVALPYNSWAQDSPERREIESWPTPSLAVVSGTWLGVLDASVAVAERLVGVRLDALTDGYLYLGRW